MECWSLGLVPSPLVVRIDVSANREPAIGDEPAWFFVVQLLPSTGVADEREDPCAELRVVRKRHGGLVLVEPILPRDRKEVEPNPDLTVVLNTEVGFDVLEPFQLGPFVVVRMVFRLPIVGHEVGRRATGYLSAES